MNKEVLNIEGAAKKTQRETLTPYKIAIVMFVNIYCDETTKGEQYYPLYFKFYSYLFNANFFLTEIVERRDFCIAALKLIQVIIFFNVVIEYTFSIY